MANLDESLSNYSLSINDMEKIWSFYDIPLSGTVLVNNVTLIFNATFNDSHGNPLMLFSFLPEKFLSKVLKGKVPLRAAFTDIRAILYKEIEDPQLNEIRIVPFDKTKLTNEMLPAKEIFVY